MCYAQLQKQNITVEDFETRILKAFKTRKEDHRLSPCKVFRKYKISLSGNAKLARNEDNFMGFNIQDEILC